MPEKISKRESTDNGHRYSFDGFEVDPGNRLLLCDGANISIPAKVFDILLVFAENPGRLLEKDELIQKVWREGFVEEGNLARHVSTLRKALGDNGRERKYIVTVQGRGYRCVSGRQKAVGSRRIAEGSRRIAIDTRKVLPASGFGVPG
jgi:DNA-binding winged helix-turn-helix (wHTH) protein